MKWLNILIGLCFLVIFFLTPVIFFSTIKIDRPTLEKRMETCNFPTYSQQLECRKIKAIEARKGDYE